MGGGRKYRTDAPKAARHNPLDLVGGATPGATTDAGPILDTCEEPRSIRFQISAPEIGIVVGAPVSLGIGVQPTVRLEGRTVGVVANDDSLVVEGCLANAFLLTGAVTAIDTATGQGTAIVSGHRPG